ncbi:hypothetical protein ACLQ2Q_09910 [Microbacterium sp. DT81.1]|uniref:hypothetical protein n=1 Tax=Microbacterium sp. DT81.1 TaxID=3393413 RepID=UPI003CE9D97B
MEQKRLAQLHSRAEAKLGRIPGVMGVGFGLKEVGGLTTEERAFRVYVREKKPLGDVPADEVLPREFEGIPVDVLVVREFEHVHCEDMAQHHPLLGGISITNFDVRYGSGTLGFFATLNGVEGPKNVVLVSNRHVLMANGAAVGNAIYQPKYIKQDGAVVLDLGPDSRRAIADIHDAGIEGSHSFAYPGETAQDYYVDASTALLKISVSSWCNSNCGVSYKNEIRQLDIGGSSRIEDVARVAQADLDAEGDYAVFKVGRKTGKTVGRVVDIAAVLSTAQRVIEIDPTAPDCDGRNQFVAEGDSGSALINAQNRLVGLVFGRGKGSEAHKGFASHIHPVMDRLKITPVSMANPPVKPAGQAGSARAGASTGEQDASMQLRQRAQGNPGSAPLYAAFERHREEAVGLVNYHRPVTVAWHKGKGPAWLAHIAENARSPEHRIPFEIDGVSRRDLVTRLADALEAWGSERLRGAVAGQRDALLAMIDGFDDLHELVRRLEGDPAPG